MTLLEQLERALAPVRRSGRAFVVEGRRLDRSQLEDWLTGVLYRRHHLAWDGWQRPHLLGEPGFVAGLERAANGARHFEQGWKVLERHSGGLVVTNGWARLWVGARAEAWRPKRVRVGQLVSVSFPCGREGSMPGYYVVVSRAGRAPEGRLVKLYLNLKPAGAAEWVRWLLHDPTLSRLRFEAKVFNDPRAFGRRDTAVIYLAVADAPGAARRLQAFARRQRRHVRDEAVPFTRVLARGLSWGESLPAEESEQVSYGELRCHFAAQGAIAAWLSGAPKERWREHLVRAFARGGTDLDQPWKVSPARSPRRRGRPGSAAARR